MRLGFCQQASLAQGAMIVSIRARRGLENFYDDSCADSVLSSMQIAREMPRPMLHALVITNKEARIA
jgi:hypothetical protein